MGLVSAQRVERPRENLDLTLGRGRRWVEHGMQGQTVDQGVQPLCFALGARRAEQVDGGAAEQA